MKKYCCINIFVFSRILHLHRNNKAKVQVTQLNITSALNGERDTEGSETVFSGMSVHGPYDYQKLLYKQSF